jgi:transposase
VKYNNDAERTIRKLVCIRKLSFGSQSEKGLRWNERSMTVIQTLRIQRKPVFEFMLAALNSQYKGSKMPSLLKM